MMTGTPAAQSPLDAYGLAKLVNPRGVPRFFGSFRDQVMYKITRFKWGVKDSATETVFNALRPAIRFYEGGVPRPATYGVHQDVRSN
jgi:hypothetical protein